MIHLRSFFLRCYSQILIHLNSLFFLTICVLLLEYTLFFLRCFSQILIHLRSIFLKPLLFFLYLRYIFLEYALFFLNLHSLDCLLFFTLYSPLLFFSNWLWPLGVSTSQRSPHLQTQLHDGSRLTFCWPFSYISFSSFTFPGASYRIFLLFLPWLPCHFYFVGIEQQQHILEFSFTFILILKPSSIFIRIRSFLKFNLLLYLLIVSLFFLTYFLLFQPSSISIFIPHLILGSVD